MNIPRHIQQYTGYTARIKRLPFLCIVRVLGTMLAGPLPFYTAHSRLNTQGETEVSFSLVEHRARNFT